MNKRLILITALCALLPVTFVRAQDTEDLELSVEECGEMGGAVVDAMGSDACGEDGFELGKVTDASAPSLCCIPFEGLDDSDMQGQMMDEGMPMDENMEMDEGMPMMDEGMPMGDSMQGAE